MTKKTHHSVTIPLNITVSLGHSTEAANVLVHPSAESSAKAGLAGTAAPQLEGLFGGSATEENFFDTLQGNFSHETLKSDIFSWGNALNGALCSALAYEEIATIEAQVKDQWGFDQCRCFSINNTECFVASNEDAVIVAFRGTQQTGDWLTNLNFAFTSRPFGAVHRGFYNGFELVRVLLEQTLREFDARQKKVWITGHSLGGALATIAAAAWHGQFPINGVLTYGQPAVGFSGFRSFIDVCYPQTFHRFVNDDDVVPRVPPGYRHVGKLHRFVGGGEILHESISSESDAFELDDTPTMSAGEFERIRMTLMTTQATSTAELEDSLNESISMPGAESTDDNIGAEGFFPSVSDHSMNRYLEKIREQL